MDRIANFVNFHAQPGKDTELGQATAGAGPSMRSGAMKRQSSSTSNRLMSLTSLKRCRASLLLTLRFPPIGL